MRKDFVIIAGELDPKNTMIYLILDENDQYDVVYGDNPSKAPSISNIEQYLRNGKLPEYNPCFGPFKELLEDLELLAGRELEPDQQFVLD